MKIETQILDLKYVYFNSLLFNNRHLFYNQNDLIDTDKLISLFNYTQSRNRLLKREYQLYRSKRCQIIRKFKKGIIKIKYNDIERIFKVNLYYKYNFLFI